MKPILFNTEMTKTALDGRKTVTRRVIKNPDKFIKLLGSDLRCIEEFPISKPPYQVGDILYVRETWSRDVNGDFVYRTDYGTTADDSFPPSIHKWHPSIHMPKEAARIFLRVADVRVEKLQDIDTKGMCKEGLTTICSGCYHHNGKCEDFQSEMTCKIKNRFIELWDSTIPKKDIDAYGWNANPFVWVIEFERCNREKLY